MQPIALVMMISLGSTTALAQSYLDRFGDKPAPQAPVVARAAPAKAAPAPTPAEPEPLRCEQAEASCARTATELVWMRTELSALQARVQELETPPEPDAPSSDPSDPVAAEPTTTLSLTVASAYNFRGSNYFAGKDGHGGLLAPGLSVDLPHGFSVGWWSAFQIAGSNRSNLILNGSGNEQDLIVGWSTDLSDRVSLSAGAVAYIYPFATKTAAGATAPVWLEPGVSVDVDLGVTWSTYLGHNQGLQAGIAQGSYTYANTGLSHSVPLDDRFSADFGGAVGVKGWTHGEAWRANTVDLSADLALGVALGDLSLSPGVHVVWTNTPQPATTDATFLWAGVDAAFAY